MLTTLVEENMSPNAPLKVPEVGERPPSSRQITPFQDSEGMIPVHMPDSGPVYYIVDCPFLDLVEATLLFPDGYIRGSDLELITLDKVPSCPTCKGTVRRAKRIPIPLPESLGTPNPKQEQQWPAENNGLTPPPQPHRTPTPRDQTHSTAPSLSAPNDTPSNSVTQVSQSPFPDDLIVNDRVPPVLPGSPGRAHSIFSNTSSNRHRISMRLWPFRSREPRLDPLPDNLTFTFSATGESVLLWRLNGNSLVRIQVKDRTSCSLPLRTALQAYDGDKTVTIKSAHEGKEWIAIILDNKQRYRLLVTHCSGAYHSLLPLPAHKKPLVLQVSRDDAYIAIGYGSSVELYRYSGHYKVWGVDIPILEVALPNEVKFQRLSFTPDGRFLAVATQRYDPVMRGPDDDAVSARLWRCEQEPGAGTVIGSTFMPTSEKGLTSVFFDPTSNKAFLAGLNDTPYQLFHGPSTGGSPRLPPGSPRGHRKVGSGSSTTGASVRIRCAAQSAACPGDVCVLTATNRLLRADLQTQALTPWADVGQLRAQHRLSWRDEAAALAWPDGGARVCLVWKDGASFWLAEVGAGASAAEMGKWDLRFLIDQSGWMEVQ